MTDPARVPLVSGTSTSPELNSTASGADAHPCFFRTAVADHVSGHVLADVAYGVHNGGALSMACRRLAVVYVDRPWGGYLAEAIARRFADDGGTVAAELPYGEGLSSFESLASELVASSADCIAFADFPDAAVEIARAREAAGGAGAIWLAMDALADGFLIRDLPARVRSTLVGVRPGSDPSRPERRAFDDLYRSAFGEEPSVFTANVYDASALLLLAIARAGSTDGDAIREALFTVSSPPQEAFGPGELGPAIGAVEAGTDVDFVGATGSLDFQDNGDVLGDFEVWRWSGSEIETITVVEENELWTAPRVGVDSGQGPHGIPDLPGSDRRAAVARARGPRGVGTVRRHSRQRLRLRRPDRHHPQVPGLPPP